METTTLTIHLSKDASLALEKKARNTGKQVKDYVEGLLEVQAAGLSLDQVFAPIRDGFEKNGMSESELSELIDTELKAVRSERRRT